ncbi:MAG: hypothetical protein ACLTCP_06645 [Ruminococcus bicirculans (ex Wegman et al. 2014)]
MYKQGKYPIVSKKTLAKGIFDIEIYCPHIAKAAKAGQFAQVQAEGFFLRRPISICDINKDKGTIRLVFEVRGHGTDKISELNKGDLVDIIAPLGNGFKVLERAKSCLYRRRHGHTQWGHYKEYGENATVISGFKTLRRSFCRRTSRLWAVTFSFALTTAQQAERALLLTHFLTCLKAKSLISFMPAVNDNAEKYHKDM